MCGSRERRLRTAFLFTDTELAYLASQCLGARPPRSPTGRCGHAEALAADGARAALIRIHPERTSFGLEEPETEAHSLHRNARDVP